MKNDTRVAPDEIVAEWFAVIAADPAEEEELQVALVRRIMERLIPRLERVVAKQVSRAFRYRTFGNVDEAATAAAHVFNRMADGNVVVHGWSWRATDEE